MIRFIPILTTLFSIYFFIEIYKHWRNKKEALYLLWWCIGIVSYGMGTLVESIVGIFGWSLVVFKMWYIFGALLGGAILAQGTIYLLIKRRTADTLTIILISVIVIATILVILSPVDYSKVEVHRLTGKVLKWQYVRLITPFINLYGFVFLVGGAIYSAIKYFISKKDRNRMWGNIFIAIGATLPGIGGSFTKFGYTEVLYVTEFIGLILIYIGYERMKSRKTVSIHNNQQV
jgi:hypothetical protein